MLANTLFHDSFLFGKHLNLIAEEALSLLKQDDFVLVCVPGYNAWLISAPTRLACERLEAVKKRPKGKRNFTHAIGDLDKFYDIIDKECIPPSLDSSDKLKIFEQAHMRVAITQDESVNNILVRNGLIQGTLWPEADFEIRNFFKEIEDGLEGHCDPDMINGNVYHSALVTSSQAQISMGKVILRTLKRQKSLV